MKNIKIYMNTRNQFILFVCMYLHESDVYVYLFRLGITEGRKLYRRDSQPVFHPMLAENASLVVIAPHRTRPAVDLIYDIIVIHSFIHRLACLFARSFIHSSRLLARYLLARSLAYNSSARHNASYELLEN